MSSQPYWYSNTQFRFNLSVDEIRDLITRGLSVVKVESYNKSGDYSFTGVVRHQYNNPVKFVISINRKNPNNVADVYVNNVSIAGTPTTTDFIDPLMRFLLQFTSFEYTNPQAFIFTQQTISDSISKAPNVYGITTQEPSISNENESNQSTFDGILLESDLNDNFRRLSWENAEDLVGTLFSKKGYDSTVTQRSGDFGIDVEARTDREFIGIQVKHWNGTVDFDTVAKTLGVQNKYNRVIIVSTKAGFSSHALTWANRDENRYRIELWDTNRFKNELRQYVLRQ